MTVSINEELCKKYGLTLAEVLATMLVQTGESIPEVYATLEGRKVLVRNSGKDYDYLVTQPWDDKVCTILLDSDSQREPEDRVEKLALSMMQIFPKMKKAGTSHYFRGNKKEVSLRLKKFLKVYGKDFTDGQILGATKRYVESFNGQYAYMRILKYFIWKDERKLNEDGIGYVENVSDLATYIENSGEDLEQVDWTSSLR